MGLFESVVFDRENHFELQYLNPVIFYKAIEGHLGSPDNSLVGMDFKANFLKHFSLYGQFLLDEFRFEKLFNGSKWWGNKYGFQTGLKYIDVAGISNLDVQLEYNMVRPYTYTHTTQNANYTHFNQALAHPLGANFKEWLCNIKYRPHKNIWLETQVMFAKTGMDTTETSNVGNNLFIPSELVPLTNPEGNELLQGRIVTTNYADFTFTWMPKHNWFVDLHYRYRMSGVNNKSNPSLTNYFSIATRLNLMRKKYLF